MENFVIIVAGGTGTRMEADCPKQFLELKGKPIIIHTVQKFLSASSNLKLKIILVVHADFITYTQQLCKKWLTSSDLNKIQITTGGPTRFHSVQNGINLINAQKGFVAIHDSVRPLLSEKLIVKVFKEAEKQNCVVPAIALTDSIRQYSNKAKTKSIALERDNLVGVQTPQCYQLQIIKKAYNQKCQSHFTDSASVVEFLGYAIHLVEGEYFNIKITRPIDLKMAEILLN